MRIAYIISAYKLPDQLVRLVKRLNREDVFFMIHVDLKSGEAIFETIKRELGSLPNVVLLARHKCYWGDFGHVRATLKGIEEIKCRDLRPDWVVLLTGQDYPLCSHADLVRFFSDHADQQFIETDPMPKKGWTDISSGMRRISYWHFHWRDTWISFPEPVKYGNKAVSLIWKMVTTVFRFRRRFPEGFKPYGGSGYWCLTGPCVDYIAEFVRRTPSFVRFFHHAYISDEIFFQTVIMSSPFAGQVVSDDIRCIDWDHPNPAIPRVFEYEDVERVAKSGKLFGRKFDTDRFPQILDMIDKVMEDGCAGG